MNGGAQSIALSGRSIGRSPVGVIDSNRRAVPRPLFNHLGNLRIAEHKAVFDGIASAIEGALQTDPGIGVASDFLSPAVRFINDGLQFFQSQGWLRNQLSVFAYPRAMRHVDLDPVRAVVELLASRLACLDRAVDQLGSLGQRQLGRVAFQRVSAGGRNRARRDE